MNSFKTKLQDLSLPISAVWQMNAISEFKGKEDLFVHQSPQILKALVEMAVIESAESSNRIEGVTVDRERVKPLLLQRSRPRDRSEEELAGYRKALDLIHRKHASISINPATILELHRMCRYEVGDAGEWKAKDNEIIKKHPNGRIEVLFRTVSAKDTPGAVEQLCLNYEHGLKEGLPALYAIACLVLDFLCIHPFRDGHG
jgi:Fic family protein